MPPKKRPINKKAIPGEETEDVEGGAPAAKKNVTHEHEEEKTKAQAIAEPVEEKKTKSKAPAKKTTKALAKDKEENETKQRKKNVKNTEDIQPESDHSDEPPKKSGRVKKKEKQKPDENSDQDGEKEQRENKPKKRNVKIYVQSDSDHSEEPPKKRGRVKKEEKPKPDENSDQDEVENEKKPKTTQKRGKQAKPEKKETSDKVVKKTKEPQADKKKTTEKEIKSKKVEKEKPVKKAPAKKKARTTSKEKAVNEVVNTTETDWEHIDFNCDKKNGEGNVENFKITTWNVDGMRAWLKKDGLNILKYGSPDILCLQETKCNEESVPAEIADVEGYHKFWCSSDKNGYAGVGLLTKEEPIQVIYGIGDEGQDEDGRCITAEFEKFFLVTVYVPNAGRKLVTLDKRLDWNEAFKNFIKEHDKKKPVIICGDMNVAHGEIDLKNPKTNTKNAGFTPEEREGMSEFLEAGFVDTFRALHPDQKDCYTFWTYMMSARKKNIGWRLDYFLVSERVKDKVCDNVIHDKVFGSDHCPLTLFINI